MFVPPLASSRSTKASARSRSAAPAGCSSVAKGVAVLAKATMLNRSSGRSRLRTKRRAPLACSILGPAMLPLVSKTRLTSWATGRSGGRTAGAARSRK